MRTSILLWLTVWMLIGVTSDGSPVQDGPNSEITPAARKAIDKGIRWLIKNQNSDGSWGCQRGQPPSVALTSLSVLVMMADGSTPERGPHAKEIQKGLQWIHENRRKSTLMAAHDSTAMGKVFEHAAGTLMFSTLYGMARKHDDDPGDEKTRELLNDALEKLERVQLSDGGWGKNVEGSSDPGVSAMAYLAIRTGFSCGINRDRADLEKVKAYGRQLIANSNGKLYPLACAIRLFAGQAKKEETMPEAVQMLLKKKLGQDYGQMSEWDYMAAFFSVGGLIHDDQSVAWKKWFTYLRDFLVKIQQLDGSWIVEYCLHCKVFATTLSLLSLQMPGRYLPSHQY